MVDKTKVFNEDCLIGMFGTPDKYYDLAIVDVPYGIGANKMQLGNGHRTLNRGATDWDSDSPPIVYFNELIRVSKNQIVWGANHFISKMPFNSSCWIVWDKGTGENDFADCELAWTSFDSTVRKFLKSWVGANAKERNEYDRIHPTQKPVALYKWLLKNYAKEGDKILDTHGGSMSSVIACLDMGFPITCYEIDTDYYNAGKNRITNHLNQLNAFRPAYEIEFHDSTGVSTLRNQQGIGYKEQNNGENKEPIHRIDGLFHGDTE